MGIHIGRRKAFAKINDAYKSLIQSMDADIANNISKGWLIDQLKKKLVSEYGFSQAPSTRTIYRAFKMCPELRREISLWRIEKSLSNTTDIHGCI